MQTNRTDSPPLTIIACSVTLAVLLLTDRVGGDNSLLNAALDSITAAELYEHVDVLADDTLEGRAAGSRGGQAAARYIESRLTELGVAPAGEDGRFTQMFYGSHRNVLARVDGSDEGLRGQFIVVGAHYDHVGYGTSQNSNGPTGYIHNGADDNASGVAVLLETIEAFTQLGQPPRRSILFAFWDGEEQGLLGSRHWTNQPTVPMSDVQLSVNIDMVGRLRDGRLEVGGTRSGFGLRQLMASRTLPADLWLHYDWELKENSDHWPFFQRGVPVVLLHTGMHDDYHRPSDDIEKVNRDGMRDVAAYLFDSVYRMANADELPGHRSVALNETPQTRRRRERPLETLPPRLGVAFRNADRVSATSEGEGDDIEGLPPSPDALPEGGVVVTELEAGSAADLAGIKIGDRIVRVGGELIADGDEFLQLIQVAPAETSVEIVRDGEADSLLLDVRLTGEPVRLGISWRDDAAEPNAVYLTRVVPGTPAAVAGLRLLDRVYRIDGAAFDGSDQFGRLLAERLDRVAPFTLGIERFGRLLDVEVLPPAQSLSENRPSEGDK